MPTTSLLGIDLPEDSDALAGIAEALRTAVAALDKRIIRKGSTEGSQATTLQLDNELFFAAVAGTTYRLHAHLIMGCASGGVDAKVAIGHPGGTMGVSVIGLDPATTGSNIIGSVNLGADASSGTSGTAFEVGVPNSHTGVHLFGMYECDTDGTVNVKWCQLNGDATDLNVHQGSSLTIEAVAS